MDAPLVSCLCITRKRVRLLKRAIDCFRSQTFFSKELVIVVDEDDAETLQFVKGIPDTNVRIVIEPCLPKKTLGQLRNLAIDKACGTYVCQWDDDDWYHCRRIELQVEAARKAYHHGAILTNWMMFDAANRRAYFSFVRLWEGSLLLRRDIVNRMNIKYPSLSRGEDTIFINHVVNNCKLFPLVVAPIYIYTIHETNTWDRSHFDKLLAPSQPMSPSTSLVIEKILAEEYTNAEASAMLHSESILDEINFSYSFGDSNK